MLVILKPTTACNGTCLYCSAAPVGKGVATLDADRLRPLFQAFLPWLRADPTRKLGFLWHGGEPMVMGLDFYRRAAREQERVFGEDRDRVTNRMQTNLTLLDDEWVEFLRDFVVGVGTSYDPIPGVRGLRSCEPLASKWLPSFAALRRAGIASGVVYVVHRRSLPHASALYRFFSNLDVRGRVRLNPLYRAGRAAEEAQDDLSITPEEYGRFLVEVATCWLDDGGRTSLMPLREWHDAWQGGQGRLSCDSHGRCQETLLGIDPEGNLYGCGRFSDDADPAWRLGNVFEDDLETTLAHPGRRALLDRGETLRSNACEACAWWDLCHGGCPMMGQLYYGDALRETYFCAARKQVFAFLEERLGPPSPAAPGGNGVSAEAAT